MSFDNMSIAKRLGLGFLLLIMITLIVGGAGRWGVSNVTAMTVQTLQYANLARATEQVQAHVLD